MAPGSAEPHRCTQGFQCQLDVVGPSSEGPRGISPGVMALHWALVPQQGSLGPGVYFGVQVAAQSYNVRLNPKPWMPLLRSPLLRCAVPHRAERQPSTRRTLGEAHHAPGRAPDKQRHSRFVHVHAHEPPSSQLQLCAPVLSHVFPHISRPGGGQVPRRRREQGQLTAPGWAGMGFSMAGHGYPESHPPQMINSTAVFGYFDASNEAQVGVPAADTLLCPAAAAAAAVSPTGTWPPQPSAPACWAGRPSARGRQCPRPDLRGWSSAGKLCQNVLRALLFWLGGGFVWGPSEGTHI